MTKLFQKYIICRLENFVCANSLKSFVAYRHGTSKFENFECANSLKVSLFVGAKYIGLKTSYALIAQLDRALVYGTKGLGFESPWVRQKRIKRTEELISSSFYFILKIYFVLALLITNFCYIFNYFAYCKSYPCPLYKLSIKLLYSTLVIFSL